MTDAAVLLRRRLEAEAPGAASFADGARAFAVWRDAATAGLRMAMARAEGGRIADLHRIAEPPDPFARRPPLAFEPGFPGLATAAERAERRRRADLHLREMWGRGRPELADALYDPGIVDHDPAPGQRPGIPGILDALAMLRDAVSGLRMTVHDILCAGRHAADRWTIEAVHDRAPLFGLPPAGAALRFGGMDLVRFDDAHRITDVWHIEAFGDARAQIAASLTRSGTPAPSAPP